MQQERVEQMDQAECWARLTSQRAGHVGYSAGALPRVMPVRYAVLDGDVIVAARRDDAAHMRGVVCLEIDGTNDAGNGRWFVLVIGHADEAVRDRRQLERCTPLGVEPEGSVPGEEVSCVRIRAGLVSGHRTRTDRGSGG